MVNDIVSKLNQLLSAPFSREADIVYCLVEFRKILDSVKAKTGTNSFPMIRFYADWVVHTDKSHITPQMRSVMTALDGAIPMDIVSRAGTFMMPPELRDFMYKKELQAELIDACAEHGLTPNNFTVHELWLGFLRLLVQVLTDQPIVNPIPSIAAVRFEPAASGAVVWMIEFNDVRDKCRFGNYY
jgi:hypothetical protein